MRAACSRTSSGGLGEARLGTRERDALAARPDRREQTRRGGRDEEQRGLRGRLFEQPQQRVLRLLIEPLGVGDHRGAAAAFVRAQPQRLLHGPDLTDAHARVVGAALDPEEVRVIADVAQQRTRLAGSVERDRLANASSAGSSRRTSQGSRGRRLADETARKAERGLARRRGRAGEQIGGVDAARSRLRRKSDSGSGAATDHGRRV